MRSGDDFPEVVSGRVTARAKQLMNDYGFTVRDAVEWYLIYMVDPRKKVELQKSILKERINNLKIDLIAAEMELAELENGGNDG
ncbi:MAG: hypothetical protein ACI389_05265 [Methanobrevibacter sp.]|uniref:hypothetical protein n=1 Tax=Methanobrevibacter sp. TaxID=66852 RepID=UPI003F0AA374